MNPLLPFLMAGDPSLPALAALLSEAKALGLEALELGLPHSDPIADGPVLQAAAHRAIQAGATPLRVLEHLHGITDSPDLVLFTYFNPMLQIGVDPLLRRLERTPVRSLLVVDLPQGEAPDFEEPLRAAGYPMIPLIAPTTSLARAAGLLASRPDPGPAAPFAQRFAYVVARLGVTGVGGGALDGGHLRARITGLSGLGSRPLAVGFGLSDPASLTAVRDLGATPVIGSALVEALHQGKSLAEALVDRLPQSLGRST